MSSIPIARPLKYHGLADELRTQITSGALKPGDRLPGFAMLRAHFGATQSTAHKAFDLLAQEGLIVRQQGRGIFVAAQSKQKTDSAPSGIIGVSGLSFDFDAEGAYWMRLLEGVRRAALEGGAQILLLDHLSNVGWEKADGVLVCDWSAHDLLDRMSGHQPCVSMMLDKIGMASVTADDEMGGRIATEYLLELGHSRIAYLHGNDANVVPHRLEAYRNVLADAGIIPDGRWARMMKDFYRTNNEFQRSGREAMNEWLEKDWHKFGFTALLCQNDATALGAIEALTQAGLSVPEDVSVIGFDGAEDFPQIPGGVTTVEVPLTQIGAKGIEVLLRQISADKVFEEHCALPLQLKVGGTTAVAHK